jgi:hypothetical protein
VGVRDPFGEGPAAAKARRKRSLGIALLLVGFVVLLFSVTLVRYDQNRDAGRQERAQAVG